jgi:hypothetical protein
VKKAIIFIIIIFALVAVFLFIFGVNFSNDISKISDKDIIKILQRNQDAKDYMQKYPDFKIDKKAILSKDDIIQGQDGQNFKEVYQELELADNRYVRVNLTNSSGDRAMITIIDFKIKSAIKAYGIILFKANAKGQTTNQTTN